MWCDGCNRVAYCSRECRGKDGGKHQARCDGRWEENPEETLEGEAETINVQGVRGEGFVGQTTGAQEAKVRAFRRHPPGAREPESSTLPGEGVVEDAQGQHRDALIQLIQTRRISDAWKAMSDAEWVSRM